MNKPMISAKAQRHSTTPWIIFGGFCIAAILGSLGFWGSTAPLASAIVAPGQITVDTNTKAVAHLEGGIVDSLFVRNGTQVKAGELLVALDDTRARANVAMLQGMLDEIHAQEARLKAEITNSDTIEFPQSLLGRRTMPEIAAIMESQQRIMTALRAAREGRRVILEQRIKQLEQEIVGITAQRDASIGQGRHIGDELSTLEELYEDGFTTKTRILALKREATRLDGIHGELTARIASSERAIGETRLEIIQSEKEFQQDALRELRDIQAQIFDTTERLSAAQDVLLRVGITAPVSGTIVGLTVHSSDAIVRPGETILEIVPDQDELLVEVQVQPLDVDNVTLGQTSQIRLSGLKQRKTPLLHGEVSYISPDTIEDPRSGLSFYQARIAVPTEQIARLGDITLTPGMPAEAMIEIGSRTAITYLLQPIQDSMRRAWRED